MIKLSNVWYRYPGSRTWALRGINIEFNRGKTVVIRGPNGSGKTTLLKIASLIYRPTKGSVHIDGIDVWKSNAVDRFRGRIAYVHDKPIMVRGTAYDNIALGLRIRGYPEEMIRETAIDIAKKFSIDNILWRNVNELSAGQKQAIALARVLAIKPMMLLLDEPLTNLDEDRRRAVIEALNEFRDSGLGVVIATHLHESMEGIEVNEVIQIENGSIKLLKQI